MVNLIGPLAFHEEVNIKHFISSKCSRQNNKYPRHAVKSKHHLKPRCKKLYKYRLRRNGEEDPDVIDVSHILLSSLKIRSPTKLFNSPESISSAEDIRPKNYLFKMARRKQKVKRDSTEVTAKNSDDKGAASVSPGTESQEKKMNAFKLLMDSRYKSIGTNSPGKEKTVDPSEIQETIEKKNLKVKRNLALQKMAEAKGSLKRKEMEEYQDKCIERQMEKRAERLKNMIKPKNDRTIIQVNKVIKLEDDDSNTKDNKKNNRIDNKKSKPSKTLHLVDMFKDDIKPNNISPVKRNMSKEDKDFLRKLSPSIKKKENMLCYFKKLDKNNPAAEVEDTTDNNPVIKVELSYKNKNKMKKKRLSLHKNPTPGTESNALEKQNPISDTTAQGSISKGRKIQKCKKNLKEVTELDKNVKVSENFTKTSFSNRDIKNVPVDTEILPSEVNENSSNERRKRKWKENFKAAKIIDKIETNSELVDEIGRPKRNIKKPVKYVDDVQLSSSDEELHIFTPRKKKRSDDAIALSNKQNSKEIFLSDDESKINVSTKVTKNSDKEEKLQKKPAKLAPIFAHKPQLNPEEFEAKQKFLYSGVPDQIKKIIAQQKSLNLEITNDFPVVVHVQQKETTMKTSSEVVENLSVNNSDDENVVHNENCVGAFGNLITSIESDNYNNILPPLKNNVYIILQTMKETFPKFPVHRTFRLLKMKSKGEFKEVTSDLDNSSEIVNGIIDVMNENPECLNWTDKYKATSTKHLFGNFDSIKELKKWLLSWTETTQKTKNTKESDSSDFYDSDTNSRESLKNNLLIVTGPVGCGKTSSVYAVATELAIKVIEVNASSKRTGKVMLQDLQEATQSHKVNRGGSDNSQKLQEMVETISSVVVKKRGRPKKKESSLKKVHSKDEMLSQGQTSQEQIRTGMSLILVDDADIVFDQDDGFSSAIAQLIQCSKRPVILVTASLTCSHLQRFLQYGKVINMRPLSPKILGTWLDIMCLADGTCWPGLGAKVLDYFRGDIRKSINCLQFCMTAYTQNYLKGDEASSQNNDFKQSPSDENSNMSWPDSEEIEDKNMIERKTELNDIVWKYFMDKETNLLHLKYPQNLFSVWWNIPHLLKEVFNDTNSQPQDVNMIAKYKSKQKIVQDLEAIANVVDSLSISEYISSCNPDSRYTITSKPWFSSECDSVSEQGYLECYDKSHELTSDIIQGLISGTLFEAQKRLQCDRNTLINHPSMVAQRDKDRVLSRHDNLTDMLNPSAALDRKALALDYWSSCRTICRMEKNKTDTVSKRNNRFCHYLKSMNVMCRNESFDILADSLVFKGKSDN